MSISNIIAEKRLKTLPIAPSSLYPGSQGKAPELKISLKVEKYIMNSKDSMTAGR
jgi:hypothetical protein